MTACSDLPVRDLPPHRRVSISAWASASRAASRALANLHFSLLA
eukprot:CAMPEP_0181374618 /NCGR_PEP_ID=MMETSP1106-20121128/16132_1 /TAXON_ID=81844 /ORGANISM="Mantoniella antarctica, Strain SL-175" /LENGTH=43 /DNA_ID= /DNA_START= /DNA_END= /DNA_ORIENTATION=